MDVVHLPGVATVSRRGTAPSAAPQHSPLCRPDHATSSPLHVPSRFTASRMKLAPAPPTVRWRLQLGQRHVADPVRWLEPSVVQPWSGETVSARKFVRRRMSSHFSIYPPPRDRISRGTISCPSPQRG